MVALSPGDSKALEGRQLFADFDAFGDDGGADFGGEGHECHGECAAGELIEYGRDSGEFQLGVSSYRLGFGKPFVLWTTGFAVEAGEGLGADADASSDAPTGPMILREEAMLPKDLTSSASTSPVHSDSGRCSRSFATRLDRANPATTIPRMSKNTTSDNGRRHDRKNPHRVLGRHQRSQ